MDMGRIHSLPLGSPPYSESIVFYNGSENFAKVVEDRDWMARQYLHLAVRVGANAYPGITFNMRGSIPHDARLVIRWRAKGNPTRTLIDVTDGPPLSEAARQGANFYVYADTPGELWSTFSFPLASLQRNPVQPPGAPVPGNLRADGIQSVSITFFPHSDFDLDLREIGFVWKIRHGFSSALIALLLVLGMVFLWRMRSESPASLRLRTAPSNSAAGRLAFVALSLAVSIAVLDPETRLFGIASLFTFGVVCALALIDEFYKANWTLSRPWLLRYLVIALAGFFLDFTNNVFILALLLAVALIPSILAQSRWYFVGALLAAPLALFLHPRIGYSSTFAPGLLVIAAVAVVAVIAYQILQQQRTRMEARYIRSLYREVLESTSDGIYILSSEGCIEAANRGFEILVGRPGGEILGRNIRDFVHKEDHVLLDRSSGSLPGSEHRQYDLRFINQDGNVRFGLVREAVMASRNTPDRYQAVATDITERKRIEVEREKLVSELQTALAEVKALSGLLPICAACKKVRDDTGYWSQIEAYVSARSKAQFTHSICPDCMMKLYPDVVRKSDH